MNTLNRDHLSQLVVENKLREALTILLESSDSVPLSIRKRAQLLLGRLSALDQQQVSGTIDNEDYQLELNRIRLGVLQLVSREESELESGRVLRRLISVIIVILVAGTLSWILSRPTSEFEVAFKNFQGSRIALQSSKVANMYLGQKVEALSLYNFKRIAIDADSLGAGLANSPGSGTSLEIKPLPGVSNVSLHLGLVSLESLNFEDSAQIVISQIEDAPNRFRIQVQQSVPFSGTLNYAGELALSGAYVDVERAGNKAEYFEPFEWQVYSPPTEAREIRFSGDPANFIFEFTLRDSIVEKELLVRQLEFFQPEQQQVKSSILGGLLTIQETDQPPLKTIRMEEGDRIDLVPAGNILLRRLSLQPSGLFLQAAGKLNSIYTYDSGDRRLRNPSRFAWLWHNHKIAVLLAGVLSLAVLLVGSARISGRILAGINRKSKV